MLPDMLVVKQPSARRPMISRRIEKEEEVGFSVEIFLGVSLVEEVEGEVEECSCCCIRLGDEKSECLMKCDAC